MISIYTELGSLFDERRMILTKLAHETGHGGFNWGRDFAEVHKARRYDIFEYPEFGFTEEGYKERLARRTKEDFADQLGQHLFPTDLLNYMFRVVREIEFGVGQLIQVDEYSVVVNIWPYRLESYEISVLEQTVKDAVRFPLTVSVIDKPHKDLNPNYLHRFSYVFKYDFLLSTDMEKYWREYGTTPNSDVKFIVPDVLARKTELPGELEAESLKDLIGKLSIAQGGKATWVCIDKSIYSSRA